MRIGASLFFSSVAWSSALLLEACDGSGAGDQPAADSGVDAQEVLVGVEPPPMERIFVRVEVPVDVNGDGIFDDVDANGVPVTEILFYFDQEAFLELCVVPDLDSFDDYENLQFGMPRGTTPAGGSEDCPRDGIITGPMHDELYPSKWCRIRDCIRRSD